MYVIRRIDQGGGWVARPGSGHSYTKKLQNARVYSSREAAEQDRCPGGEVIESVDAAIGHSTPVIRRVP